MYSPDVPYTIYCPECWWSDKWDPFQYGRDYDFSRPFFEQFNELMREAPMIGLSIDYPTLLESPHNNHAGHLKNCYLVFQADMNEDSAYGIYLKKNKTIFDCSVGMLSELCYDCMNFFKSSRCVGGRGNLTESLNCAFLRDSDNCQNCFASANLRNKQHVFFNKQLTKEVYQEEIKKWDLGSYKIYEKAQEEAENHYACPQSCVRLDLETAMDYDFKCPECSKVLKETDKIKEIEFIKKEISMLEQEILEEVRERAEV